jgi:hypothetical protein
MAKKVGENQWLIELKENQETKELYLDLPLDALSQVGWDEGDTLIWEELDNGNWRLSKKEEL